MPTDTQARTETTARGTKAVSRSDQLRERMRTERQSVYREAISEAAERVFAEQGSAGSKVTEIASEAGISLGTLYSVIDGKDEILHDLYLTRMQEFFDCIRAARDAHDDTLGSHLAVLREGGRFFLERPDFLRICSHDGYAWASRLPETSEAAAVWMEGAAIPKALFERGIAEGIYVEDEPELLVRKMLALKQVELTHWLDAGPELSHEEVLDRLEDQFLRAFCTERPGR